MVYNGLKWLKMHFKHHFFLKCGKCPGLEPPPQMWNFPLFFFWRVPLAKICNAAWQFWSFCSIPILPLCTNHVLRPVLVVSSSPHKFLNSYVKVPVSMHIQQGGGPCMDVIHDCEISHSFVHTSTHHPQQRTISVKCWYISMINNKMLITLTHSMIKWSNNQTKRHRCGACDCWLVLERHRTKNLGHEAMSVVCCSLHTKVSLRRPSL